MAGLMAAGGCRDLLEISPPFNGEPGYENWFPCSAALIVIGEPAIDEKSRDFDISQASHRIVIKDGPEGMKLGGGAGNPG